MKKFLPILLFCLACSSYSFSQVICIQCFNQNDSISSGVNNLLLNGSFENNNCTPNSNGSSFCPNSVNYNCTIADWTGGGGGSNTYASMWTNGLTVVPDGNLAVYFGNDFCNACSPTDDDISCLQYVDCTVIGIPSGYPKNTGPYGGTNGVTLEQTVNGLVPNDIYVLEFWTGGENFGSFLNPGMFAVDVGFGDTLLTCLPTDPGSIGTRYLVEFKAASASQTIRFTNWGHICSNCTELILDNVRLYTIAELSSSIIPCSPQPEVNYVTPSDSDICQKFCVNFQDSSTNNPTSWFWIFPGGSPATSTDENPSNICYNEPGVYDVTLITTSASGNDTVFLPSYITVYPSPAVPVITQTGNTLSSSPGSSYQWQLNLVDIPGATNQSYEITQSGVYTVMIYDENGCTSQVSVDAFVDGIAAIDKTKGVIVFPNPSNGIFHVDLSAINKDQVEWFVVNALGQIIFRKAEAVDSDHRIITVDLQQETSGIYFLVLRADDELIQFKLMRY